MKDKKLMVVLFYITIMSDLSIVERYSIVNQCGYSSIFSNLEAIAAFLKASWMTKSIFVDDAGDTFELTRLSDELNRRRKLG
jgi:hypothetical protein